MPPCEEGSACQSRINVFAQSEPVTTKPARQRIVKMGKTNVWPGKAPGAKRRSVPLLVASMRDWLWNCAGGDFKIGKRFCRGEADGQF